MRNNLISTLIVLVVLTSGFSARGQGMTLKQCITYALEANEKVKNAKIDQAINENQTRELTARALPHVEGGVDYIHNVNIQKIILENGVIPSFSNPLLPKGEVIAFQLQLKNALTGSVTASQVLFDKSLIANLESNSLYRKLSGQNVLRTQEEIIEMVEKAYYGVLISRSQLTFLESNLARLDSVYQETRVRFSNGVARQIDVYRIEVALNNIREEHEKAIQNYDLTKAVLAFQMNYSNPETLSINDSLDEAALSRSLVIEPVNFQNRTEYVMLKTRQEISAHSIQAARGAFYPKLSLFATSGYNPSSTNAGDLFQKTRYYNYTYVGARLQIPIFSGFERNYKLQSEVLNEERLKNTVSLTERAIQLEKRQAEVTFARSLASVEIQKRNLELAQENLRIIRIENQKGISNNLEVINAESDFRQAQNNYYTSLFQAYVARVDLDKAYGKLHL